MAELSYWKDRSRWDPPDGSYCPDLTDEEIIERDYDFLSYASILKAIEKLRAETMAAGEAIMTQRQKIADAAKAIEGLKNDPNELVMKREESRLVMNQQFSRKRGQNRKTIPTKGRR